MPPYTTTANRGLCRLVKDLTVFVYCVEGPAGGGKSTLIKKQQVDWPGLLFIEGRFTKTRDYSGDLGLMEATMKDARVLASLLTCQSEMVVIDRWLLSGIVYDSLRGEAPIPEQQQFDYFMGGWVYAMLGLRQQLRSRGRFYPEELQINWMFNIPSAFDLIERRDSIVKVFPFSVMDEIDAYQKVQNLMDQFLHNGDYNLPSWLEMEAQDVSEGVWEW